MYKGEGATLSGLTCTGYCLPTEAECKLAARARTITATWPDNLNATVTDCNTERANLDPIACWCLNAGSRNQTVATKPVGPWGLFDMLGNVWE